MIDNEYCNNVIEEYIKELNGPKILQKCDRMPGSLFHTPVIIRYNNSNSFFETENNMSDLVNGENEATPIVGAIQDGQVRGKKYISRLILGYVGMARAVSDQNLKGAMKSMIENAVLDVKEKHGKTYNKKAPYIGEYFLTFIKDRHGNYFKDLDSAAGYQLLAFSNCGVNPPLTIDANTFDAPTATQWNINLETYRNE